jgi:hypothetical protein
MSQQDLIVKPLEKRFVQPAAMPLKRLGQVRSQDLDQS